MAAAFIPWTVVDVSPRTRAGSEASLDAAAGAEECPETGAGGATNTQSLAAADGVRGVGSMSSWATCGLPDKARRSGGIKAKRAVN